MVKIPGQYESPYELGKKYRTEDGDVVRLTGISNFDNTYQTMCGHDGHHRYTARDFGRTTGTNPDNPDPRNLKYPPEEVLTEREKIENLETEIAELKNQILRLTGIKGGEICLGDVVRVKEGRYNPPDPKSPYNIPRTPGIVVRGGTADRFMIVQWANQTSPSVDPGCFDLLVKSSLHPKESV